jgi:hypothetical protein
MGNMLIMPEPIDYESQTSAVVRRPARIRLIAISFLLSGFVITPITAVLAILSGGAGHGSYGIARLLYPFSMLLTRLTGDTITNSIMWIALIQFPLYFVILGTTYWVGRKSFRPALIAIGSLHALAVVACFSGLLPNFS